VKRRVACLLLFTQVGITTPASSQTTDDSLTKEGIELRRTGRDAEALAVFERALAIDGSPRTRAQVALAEQALGLWVEAERDLTAALRATDDDWFVQRRSTLQAALNAIRVRLATLSVEANVGGTELWINGARAGALPLSTPLHVVAGTVTIEVRAPGFETQVRTIHVAPQTNAREVMTLVKLPAPRPPPDVSAPSPTLPEASRPLPAAGERAASERETAMRIGAWASLGGGVLLLAGAGAALLVRNSYISTYDDDSLCFHDGLTRDQRCGSYRDTASTVQTLAIVAVSTAAAALGLSFVLFALAPKHQTARMAAVRCSLALRIECGASF
jgi:hypothetical protein